MGKLSSLETKYNKIFIKSKKDEIGILNTTMNLIVTNEGTKDVSFHVLFAIRGTNLLLVLRNVQASYTENPTGCMSVGRWFCKPEQDMVDMFLKHFMLICFKNKITEFEIPSMFFLLAEYVTVKRMEYYTQV
jgi:hypothetical protein